MLTLLEKPMADLPLELKKIEEVAPDESSLKSTIRVYDLDWYMIHWLLKRWKATKNKSTQSELFQRMARNKLAALYEENREVIERLQESARRDHAVKQDDEASPPPPARSPKK